MCPPPTPTYSILRVQIENLQIEEEEEEEEEERGLKGIPLIQMMALPIPKDMDAGGS